MPGICAQKRAPERRRTFGSLLLVTGNRELATLGLLEPGISSLGGDFALQGGIQRGGWRLTGALFFLSVDDQGGCAGPR